MYKYTVISTEPGAAPLPNHMEYFRTLTCRSCHGDMNEHLVAVQEEGPQEVWWPPKGYVHAED